jgi:hypothetical protein
MKRLLVLPAILLVLAGMVLTGCPTEAAGPSTVDNWATVEGTEFELGNNGQWGYPTPVDIKQLGLSSYALDADNTIYFSFEFIANQDIPDGLKMTLVNRGVTKEEFDAGEPDPEWNVMAADITIVSGNITAGTKYTINNIALTVTGNPSSANQVVQLAIYAGNTTVGKIAEPLLLKYTKMSLSADGGSVEGEDWVSVKPAGSTEITVTWNRPENWATSDIEIAYSTAVPADATAPFTLYFPYTAEIVAGDEIQVQIAAKNTDGGWKNIGLKTDIRSTDFVPDGEYLKYESLVTGGDGLNPVTALVVQINYGYVTYSGKVAVKLGTITP